MREDASRVQARRLGKRTRHDDVEDIFAILSAQGIELWLEGSEIRYRAPPGALTTSIRGLLAQTRAAIIARLEMKMKGLGLIQPINGKPVRLPEYLLPVWNEVNDPSHGVADVNATHSILRWHGPLDVTVLNESLKLLADRHPIIASFVVRRHNNIFLKSNQMIPVLCFEDLSTVVKSRLGDALQARVQDLTWQRFLGEKSSLFRAFAVKFADEHFLIGFVIHHFIGDLASVRILSREWLAIYEMLIKGYKPRLQALPFGYADYLAHMEGWLRRPEGKVQRAYWTRQLANARLPPLLKGIDRVRKFVSQQFVIPSNVVDNLDRLANSARLPMRSLILAGEMIAEALVLGESDVTVEVIVSGREDPRLSGLVGGFAKSVPLRVKIELEKGFLDVASTIQTRLNDIYPYQIFPCQLLTVQQSGALHTFTLFNYIEETLQHIPVPPGRIQIATIGAGPPPQTRGTLRKRPIIYFHVNRSGNRMVGTVVNLDSVELRTRIRSIMQAFMTTLHLAASNQG